MVKILNNLYNTRPKIVHAPGRKMYNKAWVDIIDCYFNSIYNHRDYDDLDIITWSSRTVSYDDDQSHKIPMIFADSANKCDLKIKLLICDNWLSNRIKIPHTIDYLNKSKSKYVLGCDCHDSILLDSDIDFNVLNYYECKMLFNAETKFWPTEFHEMQLKQKRLASGKFRYLNGGAWFGEKETCLEFFNLAHKISNNYKEFPYSEQVCLHQPYIDLYPVVKVDYLCKMFQVTNRLDSNDITILN